MMSQTGLVCKLMISGVGILNSPDLTLNVVLEDVALGKSSSHCFSIRIFLSSLRDHVEIPQEEGKVSSCSGCFLFES